MLKTIEDVVAAILAERQAKGHPMQQPCDATRIADLRGRSVRVLGAEPPQRYLDMLRLTDGLSESSVHFFAAAPADDLMGAVFKVKAVMAGFVEANRDLRLDLPEFDRVLVLGHTELYYFVQDLADGGFALLPREELPGEYTSEFQTFDQLVVNVAERSLHIT